MNRPGVTLLLKRIVFVLLFGIALQANAQKKADLEVFFLKSTEMLDYLSYGIGLPAPSEDVSDSYRSIIPDSVNQGMFIIKDYYHDGKIKLIGVSKINSVYPVKDGQYMGFFQNGKRRFFETFKDNRAVGDFVRYYPNGKIYMTGKYDTKGAFILDKCNDSTGTAIAENGKGRWINYDELHHFIVGEGPVVNGLAEGEWKGTLNDSVTYKCIYKKGIVTSGTSYERSGKKHQFTSDITYADFNSGMELFFNWLAQNVRYPAAAREHNVQGKVFITFVVEKDGSITTLNALRSPSSDLSEETARVIAMSSGNWKPTIQFGMPVRSQFTVPVNYTLQDNSAITNVKEAYYKNSGERVDNLNDADYIQVVEPIDKSGKLYSVKQNYKNGKLKLITQSLNSFQITKQGSYIDFFPNGVKKTEANFDQGKQLSKAVAYYPNGNLYTSEFYNKNGSISLNECRDSSGNVLASGGTGKWIKYNDDFTIIKAEGKVADGVEEGEWEAHSGDSVSFVFNYKKGVFVDGAKKYKDGKIVQLTKAENDPEFPGGMAALNKFIAEKTVYPIQAEKYNIQGILKIGFTIETDGTITNIESVSGIGSGCDEAIIAALKQSPKWQPGISYGRVERKHMIIPVQFSLIGDKEQLKGIVQLGNQNGHRK